MKLSKEIGSAAEETLRRLGSLMQRASQDAAEARNVVIHVVSVVEPYVDRVLRGLVNASGMRETPLGRAMLAELQGEMVRSWEARLRWLRDGFEIPIAGTKPGQDFQTLLELRNALIHGDGGFTARQSADVPSLLELERRIRDLLNVEATRYGFVFGPKAAERALRIAREFVLAMDSASRAEHPTVSKQK